MATTEAEQPTRAEQLEARCRKAMATLTKARGWDTQRARAEELALLDRLLDEWNAETRG